jgi:hypothetical protein
MRRARGLTDERRQFREGIRMMDAERFARGEPSSVIAKEWAGVRSLARGNVIGRRVTVFD